MIMHEPATQWKKDYSSSLKELLGKWLFLLYAIVYGGFIIINVTSPEFMGIDVGGFNVAIIYGFGLIIFAMVLAFAYNHVCTRAEELMNKDEDQAEAVEEDTGEAK
jgi:uncharacterized membrane protein (DUF485 family)